MVYQYVNFTIYGQVKDDDDGFKAKLILRAKLNLLCEEYGLSMGEKRYEDEE